MGAIAANGLENDPFTASPLMPPHGPTRYASFDNEQFSTYSTNSPSQARRALEAHLKDTDRRIQDASKLGTTLLQQRKSLASRLKEVEELSKDNDVPLELQQKLTALEKEYNDIGRESARAFLPKSRPVPGDGAAVYSSSGRESPTKAAAPSRRQRNQPTNRVHDIEFATEISTQLLAQVRQLQTALAEKDEELKDATASRSQLEDDHMNVVQRAKLLDESLQRHRDENWNLETKIQDLETSMRDHADQEHRLNQTLKATQTEKSTAQRDLDELKVIHEKTTDEHTTTIRHHEADLHTLRTPSSRKPCHTNGTAAPRLRNLAPISVATLIVLRMLSRISPTWCLLLRARLRVLACLRARL
jgi:chromosome segregation ATPase